MTLEAPYLEVETDGHRRFPLQDPTTLGRLPENALPLDDAGCSSRHAVIRKEGGRWMLEDLGSTNGTWVNGERIEQPRPLKEGDRIQLGAQVLRVSGLGSATPPPTVAMRPPALAPRTPPPLPPATPPPLPAPLPAPAAPPRKRKGGCWLSCCLVSLVLLILAGVAAWFLWEGFFGKGPSPILGRALEFRQAARFDTPRAVVERTEPRVQERFQALNENLWPAVNPGLGWAYFFETSIVDPGAPSEGHLPVLFYNPWADVALITVWNPEGRMSGAEILAGDSLRRGGEAPYGGGRGWVTEGSYGPAAVGGLAARTLLAFEKVFRDDSWSPLDLRQAYAAWRDPEALEASSLACGLQFAQAFQDLVQFSRGSEARKAYMALLQQGASGRAEALLSTASSTPRETAEALVALPREHWAAFKVTSCSDLGDRVLVMAHHSERPDLFLGVVLERDGGGFVPRRLDCLSFNACYRATR